MRTTSARRAGTVTALVAVSAATAGVFAAQAAAAPDAAASGAHTLGAHGYKSLRLGMTGQQARATGLLTDPETVGSCTWYRLTPGEGAQNPGNGVVVSPKKGVVSIQGTESMRTPEGIVMGSVHDSRGSTSDQIRKAYPQYTVDNIGSLYLFDAPTPGSPDAHYRFAVGDDHKVKDMSVTSNDTAGCLDS